MVRKFNMTEKIKCQKIDKYFFKSPEGKIKKYLKYCRRKNCKTEIHVITKISNQNTVVNIKKKTW